jgi:hypothetical protein
MGLKKSQYAVACPGCGQDESLVVQMWGWYHLRNIDPTGDDDATEIEEADTDDGPYNFDGTAQAGCWSCDWEGRVSDCEAAAQK